MFSTIDRAMKRLSISMGVWMAVCLGPGVALQGQQPQEPAEVHPLASKEEMIRDRFQRMQDRVFRLRESLGASEPENAERLARVIQRAGELGLGDRLEHMIDQLRDPSSLTTVADVQAEWLEDVDRLLAILLERDSDNERRRDDIERLKEYRESLSKILEQQRGLRNQSAQAGEAARMQQLLRQAVQRVEALMRQQGRLSQQTAEKPREPSPQLSDDQQRLAREAQQLAEDLKRLAQPSEEDAQSPGMAEAKEQTDAAAQSASKSAERMSQASQGMAQSGRQSGKSSQASSAQRAAQKALEQAKERLEQALEALEQEQDATAQAQQQDELADETGALSEKMRQDAAEQSQEQQQGGQSGESAPGQQSLDQAQQSMQGAAESLNQSQPQEATPSQDDAIDKLEQAQRELEEALEQLREEEREETLRDLEARFREMLSRQRSINDATVELHNVDADRLGRAEELESADLSVRQAKLADDAATCLHILEEDGTTIAFPRVVEQIEEDMRDVATRLADLDVGTLTQAIEQEIIDALEQLLEAVQTMRQQNEQNQMPGQGSQGGGDAPLLPPSSELKLLRASQTRVNTRTGVIAQAREQGRGDTNSLTRALETVAERQLECARTATEMRDSGQ